ncbi:alpha/beta hydrolase [Gordonia sinesedis]
MPGKKSAPSGPPAKLMATLARRGPHRVLRGDLEIVGLHGQMFVPATGRDVPAIAFGHAWLTRSHRYRDLLFHLASWGIAAAAPDGQGGPFPSDEALAGELRSTLDVISRYPLGLEGALNVDPARVGFAGHGFGAAAAVLAAADQTILGQPAPTVGAVAALFPAPTTPALLPAAARATAPAMIVAGSRELDTFDANARALADAYGGDVALRTLPGATASDLSERWTLGSLIGANGADRKVHAQVRALCTGFLLYTLAGDTEFAAFGDPGQALGKSGVVDLEQEAEGGLDHISALLGAKPPKRRGKADRKSPVR